MDKGATHSLSLSIENPEFENNLLSFIRNRQGKAPSMSAIEFLNAVKIFRLYQYLNLNHKMSLEKFFSDMSDLGDFELLAKEYSFEFGEIEIPSEINTGA